MIPNIFVIFGATGDLMHRKLISGFFNLHRKELLPKEFAIVGIGRRDYDDETFRHDMCVSLGQYVKEELFDKTIWKRLRSKIYYHKLNFDDEEDYKELSAYLDELDGRIGTQGNRIFYLATKPEYFEVIVPRIKKHKLTGSGHSRIVIEKPFGRDLASAKKLNNVLMEVFSEDQIFRIDHYLAKETVQNILVLRFANGLFEPLWNQKYIDNIQITASETLGVGTRAGYYDQYGALRDMVQNHLLQLLTLIAIEPPISFDSSEIKEEKVKVLRSIRTMNDSEVSRNVVRGQYVLDEKCKCKEEVCRGYLQEKGVAKGSRTETYVALKLNVMNWRWSGVPFYLRTGKRLKANATEIVVNFKALPLRLFEQKIENNVLVIRIQPNEGIHLQFNNKEPGNEMAVSPVNMDFCHSSVFGMNTPEAYERLLHDVMRGGKTLFSRWDEVEFAWKIVDPISRFWEKEGKLSKYLCGTWGPKEAEELLRKEGHSWNFPMSTEICNR